MSLSVSNSNSGVPSAMSFHAPPSAAPAGEGKGVLAQAADRLQRGRDQVAELATHLSRLRDILVRLSNATVVSMGKPSAVPVGTYSSSVLGLDYGSGGDTTAMASVAALSGVQAGTLGINGVDVTIDPAADSLADVVTRINASGAGVRATLSKTADVISVTADGPGDTLTLSDGTSGFFTAVHVGTGAIEPSRTVTRTFRSPATMARQLEQAGEELNAVFGGDWGDLDGTVMDTRLGEFADALRDAFSLGVPSTTPDLLRTGYGLTLDLRDLHDKVFSFRQRTFDRAVAGSFDDLDHFLLHQAKGSGATGFVDGLVGALDDLTGGWLEDLTTNLTGAETAGTATSAVDVTA